MIACDKCEEWFHGECINVKESEAGNIKYYYCPQCCKRDPSLKTKYRKKKDKKDKEKGTLSQYIDSMQIMLVRLGW